MALPATTRASARALPLQRCLVRVARPAASGVAASVGLARLARPASGLVATRVARPGGGGASPTAAAAAADDTAATTTPSTTTNTSTGTLGDMLRTRGINTVAVAGATGATGRQVVRALLAASSSPSQEPPSLRVRALARSRERAATILPPFGANSQLSVAVADVEQFATLPQALKGCDALIVATGPQRSLDPTGPFNVDYVGNLNLWAAAQQVGTIKHVVFITSIGADDLVNPLNLFWGILFWKKQAESALQRSGLPYTIIRPGGLMNEGRANGIVLGGPGTWGVPPLRSAGSILRSQVADLAVEALAAPEVSAGKVFEAITRQDAPVVPIAQLFSEV
jgi:uncharacterized protein YbjT (DUF2867 family)